MSGMRSSGNSLSNRQSIMWMLGLLVVVFVTGLFTLSSLSLSYSREALSDLRRQQINEEVTGALARINARQSALASYTASLANVGESFYALVTGDTGFDGPVPKAQLEASLKSHFEDFRGAAGVGLWFEPGVLSGSETSYMPYFIRPGDDEDLLRLDTEARFERYQDAPWFSRTLESQWVEDAANAGKVFWSPVYFDLSSDRAVLTLASPMYGPTGNLLGLATTAWSAEQIIELVSSIEVTENSFAFLNDRNNRNLSSLNQGKDSRQEQALIDAILGENLVADGQANTADNASETLSKRSLSVGGTDYELYFAATAGGMVYGAGIPRNEINAVLAPMVRTNYTILLGTLAVVLVLSVYLLYRIVQLMRELQASYTDQLTGLANRARLLKDLNNRRAATFFIVNLDHFNQINSLFGLECGDQVLITLARRLADFSGQAQHKHLKVYRLPGDEFGVLAPAMKPDAVPQLAREIRDLVTMEQFLWQQQNLTLDGSIGIALRHERRQDQAVDQLVNQAKIAVLQAREQRRHHLLYDSSVGIEESYENNLYWADRLRAAIDEDRLVPWFQPIHDNRTGRVTKYECLVRMIEPDGTVINAGQFIDIANKLRLNRRITELMIDKCFACFADREEDFSINLSYGDIVESQTVERILSALKSSGLGERVTFEILESDGIADYDKIHRFIDQVKAFGCRIAVDDFGTGYSNFSHLLRMNVDYVKIDGSLIRNLHEDQTAFLVASGIVQFARSLNMATVAEFVHNEPVQDRIRELGIDFSQGEYFSMPLPSPGLSEHQTGGECKSHAKKS